MVYRRDIVVVTVALVAITYSLLYPSMSNMTSQRKYTAQRGFFSHDDDPESWDFRATTRIDLGLLDRLYPTDDASEQEGLTQWQRLHQYIRHLNAHDKHKQYKLLYLIRHGEGLHNVKEKEVGRAEWDVSLVDSYEYPYTAVAAPSLMD
jgi:hypothetical protein